MRDITSASLDLLVRRLGKQSPLTAADVDSLTALPGTIRTLEPSAYILREGEPLKHCAILKSGFAYRQKLTSDGTRQIVALHVPGDPLDFQSLYLDVADHNIQVLTRAEVLFIPREAIQQLIETSRAIARAVVIHILIEASIGREWLLNVGRRNARARVAHLLCEFAMRIDAQGLAPSDGYELPMTQEQLGDALGLTSVHVNRTLKGLEAEGVLRRQGRRLAFADWTAIARIADFSPLYLHLPERNRARPRGIDQPA